MKNIAYVTGTRADFGIITPLLKKIEQSSDCKLQLFATGMHLVPEFGQTVDLVKEKFPTLKIIDVKTDNKDKNGMAVFAGKFLNKVVDEFKKERPDLVLVHGDRVEMFCTALASFYLNLPIVHTQGGDKTTTWDDSARHAITKLAHLHFPATENSAERIKKMGEEEWRIQIVGTLGLDAVFSVNTLSRRELFQKLGLIYDSKIILVLLHPVSEQLDNGREHMKIVLNAVKRFNLPTVIVYPNTDSGSDQIIEEINKQKSNPLFKVFENLDYETFISLEKEADCWVGNSSAGVVESASFKTPVVNVGSRQTGREKGINVIDTEYSEDEIYQAINKSLNDQIFLKSLELCINPWGDGKATERIMRVLESITIDSKLLTKS